MNAALLSSKKMDYCTPQAFFDELNREFHFTLDAAATDKSAWVIQNPVMFDEPFPARGKQGWWEWEGAK
ncbi:MAG: hypothetical protein ACLR8M_00905 [Oscillospiraceae bacterium]